MRLWRWDQIDGPLDLIERDLVAHVNKDPSKAGIWWTSVSIEIFLCSLTATTAHLLMSLGQTLFHRYLGHRGIGGRFFKNLLHVHHKHYSGDHIVT